LTAFYTVQHHARVMSWSGFYFGGGEGGEERQNVEGVEAEWMWWRCALLQNISNVLCKCYMLVHFYMLRNKA